MIIVHEFCFALSKQNELLTFLPKTQKSVSGTVMDGISDLPFADAIVFLYGGSGQKEFSSITDQQWKELSACDSEKLKDHPTYKLLSETYNVLAIVKSDADGKFDLFPDERGHPYGVIAMSSGKVPVARR